MKTNFQNTHAPVTELGQSWKPRNSVSIRQAAETTQLAVLLQLSGVKLGEQEQAHDVTVSKGTPDRLKHLRSTFKSFTSKHTKTSPTTQTTNTQKTVLIPPQVADQMKTIWPTLWEVKAKLPYGNPSNQLDGIRTRGENIVRGELRELHHEVTGDYDGREMTIDNFKKQIAATLVVGGGAGSDINTVLFGALLDKFDGVPMKLCGKTDNSFILIGDPRSGPAIIVDASAPVPIITTTQNADTKYTINRNDTFIGEKMCFGLEIPKDQYADIAQSIASFDSTLRPSDGTAMEVHEELQITTLERNLMLLKAALEKNSEEFKSTMDPWQLESLDRERSDLEAQIADAETKLDSAIDAQPQRTEAPSKDEINAWKTSKSTHINRLKNEVINNAKNLQVQYQVEGTHETLQTDWVPGGYFGDFLKAYMDHLLAPPPAQPSKEKQLTESPHNSLGGSTAVLSPTSSHGTLDSEASHTVSSTSTAVEHLDTESTDLDDILPYYTDR